MMNSILNKILNYEEKLCLYVDHIIYFVLKYFFQTKIYCLSTYQILYVPTKFLYFAIIQNTSASKPLIANEVFNFGLSSHFCACFYYNAIHSVDVSEI